MDNNLEIIIIKKMIQKELLNELYFHDLINFTNLNKITNELDFDIKKLQKKLEKGKKLIIKIPI